jgi:type II secretory pathway component PulF
MPKFMYVVKDQEGKTITNVIEAPSQDVLVENLQRQNLFITTITEMTSKSVTRSEIKKKPVTFKRKKVKMEDILSFARQLATMLEAGINLIRSMSVILSQIESEKFHKIISKVKADVEQGSSLSLALSRHPKVFNQFWVSLVEVGEASGTLPTILNKLAFYLEQQAGFRSTIISGIIYPAILFAVSNGAIIFFALFVGPRFEAVFKQMDASLPLITVILLETFKWIKSKFFFIVVGLGLAIFGFIKYSKTYQGKAVIERVLFRLPTVGDIYKLIIVERFTSQMSLLIDAGVPILYALDICERLVDNVTCSLVINDVKESVKKGELLAEPMGRSNFFPAMAVQMVLVGEETGEMSKMLKHVSQFYQQTVETFMKRFATIVEPFMLVFMGGIIGTIVVAMFLPMFNLSQNIG